MKISKLQHLAAAVASIGMLAPTTALSAQPELAIQPEARSAAATMQQVSAGIDVSLAKGGLFVGQVVDAQGAAQAHTEVAVMYQGKEVVRTLTDERGMFAAQGLRGGQYEIVTSNCVAPCRLWAEQTAPPAARPAALIVASSDVVNGQYGSLGAPGGILGWMQSHPMIVAGAVVTAVAVPVAVASNDDSPSS